uniref:Uncharacterized protein n=1 Tax=Mucochytrium quahogii TaxID=96639 RepID=A0A7S2WEF4_9STRA|mmetsp:Transcript_5837/g.9066  ORF Transcript_5837/g.9066 Transcript_5837/m.9066 type:complete len:386 (+) Transcript_5837:190-1347(+)
MASMDDIVVELAACGDLDGIKEVLAEQATTGKQVNGMDKDGRSAFHYACLNDDVKLLKILLDDERCDVSLRTPKGDSGLHLASLYASLEAMKCLFADKRGLELLNSQNRWGETPLHLCAGSGDKGASKAAKLLLEHDASMTITDNWGRGPRNVACDNAENPLLKEFNEYLESAPSDIRKQVEKITREYKESAKPASVDETTKTKKANLIFAGLGGALQSLKKVSVTEKHMFAQNQGAVTAGNKKRGEIHDARSHGKVLSKLIDFPGDKDEIARLLEDNSVNAAGKDAYGLTALHKFASWNKTDFLDMLIPKLSKDDLNDQDPEGKTALHWACEMASVAAVSRLMKCPDIDSSVKDGKGRTALDIVNSGGGGFVVERVRKALTVTS